MPKSERQAKRKIRLVGGGFRYNREPNGVAGGTMKAARRIALKQAKAKGRGHAKAARKANRAARKGK